MALPSSVRSVQNLEHGAQRAPPGLAALAALQLLKLLLCFKAGPGPVQIVGCAGFGSGPAAPAGLRSCLAPMLQPGLQLRQGFPQGHQQLPALPPLLHQPVQVGRRLLRKVSGPGFAGPPHPLLPAVDLRRQRQQFPPQPLRLLLQGQPPLAPAASPVLLLLFLQQGLLGGIGAQEGLQLLLELRLQLLKPGAAASCAVLDACSGARVISGASISSCRGVIAASRERSSSWVSRAMPPSPRFCSVSDSKALA